MPQDDVLTRLCFDRETGDEVAWELFHENSKTGIHSEFPANDVVLSRMASLQESLIFAEAPAVDLPQELTQLPLSLDAAFASRRTPRRLKDTTIALRDLATILHYAYGVTKKDPGKIFPRPLRAVPSAGALYPLEMFFFTSKTIGLPIGLWHFDAAAHKVRRLREGDLGQDIAELVVQKDLVSNASVILFLSALFERSVFKYGERGYRFTLIEAGHVMQNVNLTCTALGLSCVNVGGYIDAKVDEFLDLDGLTQSTIYLAMIGTSESDSADNESW